MLGDEPGDELGHALLFTRRLGRCELDRIHVREEDRGNRPKPADTACSGLRHHLADQARLQQQADVVVEARWADIERAGNLLLFLVGLAVFGTRHIALE